MASRRAPPSASISSRRRVDPADQLFLEVPTRDARLVGHQHGEEVRVIDLANGIRCSRQQPEAAYVVDVAHFLAHRAVAVDKNRPASHHSLRTILSKRSHQTFHTASRMILPLILLVPSVRSVKMIFISPIWKPLRQARKVVSIWNE